MRLTQDESPLAHFAALMLVAIALLAALTLWLWPLMYAFTECDAGADIGIALFGFPATLGGVVMCVVLGLKYRQDRVLFALCVAGGIAGSFALIGLITGAPPYAQWISYAIDRWYAC